MYNDIESKIKEIIEKLKKQVGVRGIAEEGIFVVKKCDDKPIVDYIPGKLETLLDVAHKKAQEEYRQPSKDPDFSDPQVQEDLKVAWYFRDIGDSGLSPYW